MHGGNLVDKRFAFSVAQLVGMSDGLRCGAAMLAGQVAGLGDLPDGKEGGFVVVDSAAGGDILHHFQWHKASIQIVAPGGGCKLRRTDQHFLMIFPGLSIILNSYLGRGGNLLLRATIPV